MSRTGAGSPIPRSFINVRTPARGRESVNGVDLGRRQSLSSQFVSGFQHRVCVRIDIRRTRRGSRVDVHHKCAHGAGGQAARLTRAEWPPAFSS